MEHVNVTVYKQLWKRVFTSYLFVIYIFFKVVPCILILW